MCFEIDLIGETAGFSDLSSNAYLGRGRTSGQHFAALTIITVSGPPEACETSYSLTFRVTGLTNPGNAPHQLYGKIELKSLLGIQIRSETLFGSGSVMSRQVGSGSGLLEHKAGKFNFM